MVVTFILKISKIEALNIPLTRFNHSSTGYRKPRPMKMPNWFSLFHAMTILGYARNLCWVGPIRGVQVRVVT